MVMSILSRLFGKREERALETIDDYIQAAAAWQLSGGVTYEQTLSGRKTERVGQSFAGFASYGYAANPTVFAVMETRSQVFACGRFRWQRLRDGKPADYFSTPTLQVLQKPWTGGTTQDLLSRMINDADLAGNSFWVRDDRDELARLRPDWVEIAVEDRIAEGGGVIGQRKIGYVYFEGGKGSGRDGVPLTLAEVAHFMPTVDPLHPFRGMSWLTPLIREMQNDRAMTDHQREFFENGATPNMIIKHPVGASKADIIAYDKAVKENHTGAGNHFKTLNLYPGADATVVGIDFSKMEFKDLRGGGETRIASAGGVPPIIAGLSEGLESATYSNYGQARRRFADGTMHSLWKKAAGTLEVLVAKPGADVQLAHDASDVPFLREDEGDAAKIQQTRAATVASLIDAGFAPESAVAAVENDDFRLLVHTGLYSVQLQKPGSTEPAAPAEPAPTDPAPAPRSLRALPHYGRKTA